MLQKAGAVRFQIPQIEQDVDKFQTAGFLQEMSGKTPDHISVTGADRISGAVDHQHAGSPRNDGQLVEIMDVQAVVHIGAAPFYAERRTSGAQVPLVRNRNFAIFHGRFLLRNHHSRNQDKIT